MSGLPLVVCPGTSVLGHVGLIKSPLPRRAYGAVQELVDSSSIVCLPFGGVGPLPFNYGQMERAWERKYEKYGPFDVFAHSQPVPLVLLAAARHPEWFRTILAVGGPIHGTSWTVRRLLGSVPCARDMASESAFLQTVKQEVGELLKRKQRPRIECVAAYRDSIVRPWSSSLLNGADGNYCLAKHKPDHLPPGAVWIPTANEIDHFRLIWTPEALKLYGRLLAHRAAKRRSRAPLAA